MSIKLLDKGCPHLNLPFFDRRHQSLFVEPARSLQEISDRGGKWRAPEVGLLGPRAWLTAQSLPADLSGRGSLERISKSTLYLACCITCNRRYLAFFFSYGMWSAQRRHCYHLMNFLAEKFCKSWSVALNQ